MTNSLKKDAPIQKQKPVEWTPQTSEKWRERLKEVVEKSQQSQEEQPLPFRR